MKKRSSPHDNKINLPFEVVVERLLAAKPIHKTAKKAAPKRKAAKKRPGKK